MMSSALRYVDAFNIRFVSTCERYCEIHTHLATYCCAHNSHFSPFGSMWPESSVIRRASTTLTTLTSADAPTPCIPTFTTWAMMSPEACLPLPRPAPSDLAAWTGCCLMSPAFGVRGRTSGRMRSGGSSHRSTWHRYVHKGLGSHQVLKYMGISSSLTQEDPFDSLLPLCSQFIVIQLFSLLHILAS